MKKIAGKVLLKMGLIFGGMALLLYLGMALEGGEEKMKLNGYSSALHEIMRIIAPALLITAAINLGILWILSRLAKKSDVRRVSQNPEYSNLMYGVFEGAKDRGALNLLVSAIEDHEKGDFGSALSKAEKLLPKCKNEKDKSSVCILMGMCYSDAGQHSEAAKAYTDAYEADGTKSYLLKWISRQYMEAGLYLQAFNKLKEIAENSENDPNTYIDVAEMCMVAERYNDAIEYAEKAVAINDNHSEAYKILCRAYKITGDREKCAWNFKQYNLHGGAAGTLAYEEAWLEEN